ncbi:MAG TPA: hypothetical protein PKB06_03450, partial [Actinotalea sp.]|nr:hypothetical protein [Actinotalea sp.]
MPWQLTSLARRARGVFGVRALDEVPAEPWAPAAGRSETSPVPVVREAARVLAALTPAERAAYEGLLEDLPDARDVLARALVTTGGLTTAADLATAWSGWDAAARAAVAHPVRRLTAAARQTDPTTCGSAALALLAAAGDPALAAWLATGWAARALPSELAGATPRALAVLAERPATERFGVL